MLHRTVSPIAPPFAGPRAPEGYEPRWPAVGIVLGVLVSLSFWLGLWFVLETVLDWIA